MDINIWIFVTTGINIVTDRSDIRKTVNSIVRNSLF